MAEMTINPNIISFGNTIIPTRNIAQASIWNDETYKKNQRKYLTFAVVCAGFAYFSYSDPSIRLATQVSALLSFLLLIAAAWSRPRYELHLRTTGGDVNFLGSRNKKFMHEILSAVTNAISGSGDNKEYHVNVDAKTITEGARVNITGSTGVNVVGGNATQTAMNVNLSGVALHDITELIRNLNQIPGNDAFRARIMLEEIRLNLTKGPNEKKAAAADWAKFVECFGSILGVTAEMWRLAESIGDVIHS